MTWREKQPGMEPPTFWLADDLLDILSYSCINNPVIKYFVDKPCKPELSYNPTSTDTFKSSARSSRSRESCPLYDVHVMSGYIHVRTAQASWIYSEWVWRVPSPEPKEQGFHWFPAVRAHLKRTCYVLFEGKASINFRWCIAVHNSCVKVAQDTFKYLLYQAFWLVVTKPQVLFRTSFMPTC